MRHIYNPIIGDRYEKSLVSRQVAIVYRRSLSQETSLGPLCRRGFGSGKCEHQMRWSSRWQSGESSQALRNQEFKNPDETVGELQMQIKKEMLIVDLLKTRRKLTKEEQEIE
ncbi:unnamed protein product [Cylicocyclus nassatus]|uniref:Uncharacterized protein n=1 Tax=Cylicocyclus nassatus TaxID=53992 RepID=A0AA36MEK3_CYLNA|nr:unnamed protein product [Cylicocyclus nassatus]